MNQTAQQSSVFQNVRRPVSPAAASVLTPAFTNCRVVVENSQSPWLEALRGRLDEVVSLSFGWDGYAGRSVSFTNAAFAANFLNRLFISDVPPPFVVPGADGTLQLEWHRNNFDIEIDILGANDVVANRKNLLTGEEEEVELGSNFAIVATWLQEMKQQ